MKRNKLTIYIVLLGVILLSGMFIGSTVEGMTPNENYQEREAPEGSMYNSSKMGDEYNHQSSTYASEGDYINQVARDHLSTQDRFEQEVNHNSKNHVPDYNGQHDHWRGGNGKRESDGVNTNVMNDSIASDNGYGHNNSNTSEGSGGGNSNSDDNLYMLKSQMVPPVCPACPQTTACPKRKPCPPCPPCARCPESPFVCKKVPDYSLGSNLGGLTSTGIPLPSDEMSNAGIGTSGDIDGLPQPMLNSFASF